ncbi:hypothetical protein ED733_000209 [Metarhizium rileyi]|uniref:NAD dependent epimerase/dehydratase n=1 Tax=Metarhizium rileyi (strain RCEF 4871) TaxID=1649241 RepID=A0A5C6G2T6_METRR|nr:hypothetical protein ED733_000209 [Metarhizium rileyi]
MSRGLEAEGVGARQVPMRLMVHGVQRTGSMSRRSALHQLGFHTCYHMASIMESQNMETDIDLWIEALEVKFDGKGEKWTREDWDKLLGRSQACVDMPSALFTLELAEAYPEAKIIILNRDADGWFESCLGSVYKTLNLTFLETVQSLYCAALNTRHRAWYYPELEKAVAWFNKSYKDVRDAITEERRFEFSVKDGFAPLCKFLGVSAPLVKDEETGEMVLAPFPHVNDRVAFGSRVSKTKGQRFKTANSRLFAMISKTVTLGVMGYGGYILWKARLGGRT